MRESKVEITTKYDSKDTDLCCLTSEHITSIGTVVAMYEVRGL